MGKNRDFADAKLAIVANGSPFASMSDQELSVEEARAIEAAIAEVAPEYRERARAALEGHGTPLAAEDAKLAKHLSRLASIRAANGERVRALQTKRGDTVDRFVVRVLLTDRLPKPNAVALLVRSPGDGGLPTLVLVDTVTGPEELESAALGAMAANGRPGPSVTKQHVISLRSVTRKTGLTPQKWGRLLAYLRAQPIGELPGLGRGNLGHIGLPLGELRSARP